MRLWSRFGYSLDRVNQGFEGEGGFYLLLLRLIHAPYTFVNYAMGATRVRLRTFWWATQLGLLPGNVVFVYAGSRFPSLQDIAHGGAQQVWTPDVVLALLLVALFPSRSVPASAGWDGDGRRTRSRAGTRGQPVVASRAESDVPSLNCSRRLRAVSLDGEVRART